MHTNRRDADQSFALLCEKALAVVVAIFNRTLVYSI